MSSTSDVCYPRVMYVIMIDVVVCLFPWKMP